MIIAIAGKGGTGKTSLAALILDELIRHNYAGRILAVDADPAATLYMALGWPEPATTIAGVRDATKLDARTIRGLPPGTSPAGYVLEELRKAEVLTQSRLRGLPVDLITMGQGEGPGCYCSLNGTLKVVLQQLVARYDLVLVDNEAGLEWLNRYRLARISHFLVVTTPSPASQAVAGRIIRTARAMELEIGQIWQIYNQALKGSILPGTDGYRYVRVPHCQEMAVLERRGGPVVNLDEQCAMRQALSPLVQAMRKRG